MPRFSNFIRAPGTAGPPTREGIRALGFALQTDFPTILADYVRVDQAQAFNDPKKLQGRNNLGLGTISTQAANAVAITGGTLTGITDLAIADAGTGASTAPGARTALGLGTIATQDANAVALTGAPTAPTAAPGTDNTQIATTAFVAALVASQGVWAVQPIGALIALEDHLTGVSAPPTNQSFRYIRLTAADSYNSGVLTGESVSGSAPLVQATAIISDVTSPLNGQTVRLINTERRSVRAGSSGTVEADALQNITGQTTDGAVGLNGTAGIGAILTGGAIAANVTQGGGSFNASALTFDASRVARTGTETRPKNIGATYYMRIR